MRKPTKKTFNFFNKITVSSNEFIHVAYWDFISAGIMLLNESAIGNIVEYSFDGINTHGDLNPSLASAGVVFDNRHQDRIYFRLSSGVSAIIRVEAWA